MTETSTMAEILSAIGEVFTKLMSWIPTVLETLIAQPVVLFFLAFGVAGAVIGWARRCIRI